MEIGISYTYMYINYINLYVVSLKTKLHKTKYVYFSRPDGVGSITHEEKEKFAEIKERLRILLEYQITNFRFCFPFGRPEGALKATLSLLERVLMKDIVTPVPPEEVRMMIKKSLETAALVNYTRLSSEAKIDGA